MKKYECSKCVYNVIHFNVVFSLMYSLNCGFVLLYVLLD